MILCLTGFYFLQQFFCIFQSGNNRNFHIHTCYIVNSLFDSLDTTYIRKIKFCKFFAGQFFYCSTKSCFHNTTGCTKNDCCSGSKTQRHIEFFIRKICKTDTCTFDHATKLSCCDSDIYIRNTCTVLILSTDFKFLCSTRHNAYNHHFFFRDSHFLCIIGFGNGTKHLLRRFCR